ncbi:hypothetical protein P886_0312 [Alteromonadaceae bacterium 2753L.S.0a.02]|nr:hypothetical protein P886_0312 [Alteromonadaceae bacterium 2753L.S.0a.02]
MTVRLMCLALAPLYWLFSAVLLHAQGMSLQVVDQSQTPLKNVVIELPDSTPDAAMPLPVAIIDQVNKQFLPEILVIQSGQEVSFPNSDNIRHHVYSFSPAKTFELKLYSGKPEKPILFEKPGVVVLGCNIHDSMVGYIYISSGKSVITDAEGRAGLSVERLPDYLFLWHAQQRGGPQQRHRYPLTSLQKNIVLQLETVAPEPRDTFRARFKSGATP